MQKGKDLPASGAPAAPVPGLNEILKLEDIIASDFVEARAKAQKMVGDAQATVDAIEQDGQDRARIQAAEAVLVIEERTQKEIEEIRKLGVAECDDLNSKLSSRLSSALDYIVEQVVEGESCLTRPGVTQC